MSETYRSGSQEEIGVPCDERRLSDALVSEEHDLASFQRRRREIWGGGHLARRAMRTKSENTGEIDVNEVVKVVCCGEEGSEAGEQE